MSRNSFPRSNKRIIAALLTLTLFFGTQTFAADTPTHQPNPLATFLEKTVRKTRPVAQTFQFWAPLKLKNISPTTTSIPAVTPPPVAPNKPNTLKQATPANYIIVTSPFLRLRDAPNRSGKVIRELDHGEHLQLLERVDERWLHIETPDKKIGYVAGENTTPVAAPLAKRYLPTIIIHHVGDVPTGYEKSAGLFVAVATFETLAKTIVERGYTTVRVGDFAQSEALPEHAVALTFDDGYDDFATNALPILKKYHLTGTAYVITNRLDTPGYLTTAEVKAIADAGIEIGSHTVSHPDLRILSEKQIMHELVDSKAALEKITSQKVTTFCYPSGAYDAKIVKIVKKAGYAFARTTHFGLIPDWKKPYELPGVRLFTSTEITAMERWLP